MKCVLTLVISVFLGKYMNFIFKNLNELIIGTLCPLDIYLRVQVAPGPLIF